MSESPQAATPGRGRRTGVRYIVEVDGERFEVEICGGEVFVQGKPVSVDLVPKGPGALKHLLLGGRSYPLHAARADGPGAWRIEIDGRVREVVALEPRRRALRERIASATGGRGGPFKLVAPMPGLIVDVEVEPGEEVRRGQGLVIMEAMKMENELRCEVDGRVGAVLVEPRQTVERGEVLVVVEPAGAESR